MFQTKNKALWYARKNIAQIITDIVNLENLTYTVAEIQTLLDGITVGGHKIQDEIITINQIKSWQFLFKIIEKNSFEINKNFILQLHNLVITRNDMAWKQFRNGVVTISGTSFIPPRPEELEDLWKNLEYETTQLCKDNVYRAAINLFGKLVKTKFFFSGNKLTAWIMMNGLLLSHSYPIINVPVKRKQEFNQIMINYYNNGQFEPLYHFMISCLQQLVTNEFRLERVLNQ